MRPRQTLFVLLTKYKKYCLTAPHPHGTVGGTGVPMEQQTFSRLTVRALHHKDRAYNKYWECLCTCGATTVVREDKLRSGKIKSCGCLAAERVRFLQIGAVTAARSYTKNSYVNMVHRCTNPAATAYKYYGARGVAVCDRWLRGEDGLSGWMCFYNDMGPRPRGTSIDRIDNTKGYSPDNCRWATPHEQTVNRACTRLTADDVRAIRSSDMTRRQAAAFFGVSEGHIKKIRSGKAWGAI